MTPWPSEYSYRSAQYPDVTILVVPWLLQGEFWMSESEKDSKMTVKAFVDDIEWTKEDRLDFYTTLKRFGKG